MGLSNVLLTVEGTNNANITPVDVLNQAIVAVREGVKIVLFVFI